MEGVVLDFLKTALSRVHKFRKKKGNVEQAASSMAEEMQRYIKSCGYQENHEKKLRMFFIKNEVQEVLRKYFYKIEEETYHLDSLIQIFKTEFAGSFLADFDYNECLLKGLKRYRESIDFSEKEVSRVLLEGERQRNRNSRIGSPVFSVSSTESPENGILSIHIPIAFPSYIAQRSTTDVIFSALHNHKKVSLFGIAGSGKSSIAKEVFYTAERAFSNRAWIHFKKDSLTYRGFLSSLTAGLNLGTIEELNDSQVEKNIYEFILRYGYKLLLILDNIDTDAHGQIASFLGKCCCTILVTTRRKEFGSFWPIALPQMPEEDCIRLYRNFCIVQSEEEGLLPQLIQRAGRLPLVVEFLAKTQKQCMYPLKWMLQKLDEDSFNLGNAVTISALYDEEHSNRTLEEHLKTVFALHRDLSQFQQWLVKSIVIFPDDFISVELFVSMIGEDDLQYRNSLKELEVLGWITIVVHEDDYFIWMHNVIREMAIQLSSTIEGHEFLISSIINLLESPFVHTNMSEDNEFIIILAERALKVLNDDETPDLRLRCLRFFLGKAYMRFAMYQQSTKHLFRVYKEAQIGQDVGDVDMLYLLCELARSYQCDGYPSEAKACIREAKKYISTQTSDDLRAELYEIVSLILQDQGEDQKAYYTLLLTEKFVGESNLVDYYQRLATICHHLDNDQEALKHCKKALSILESKGIEYNTWVYGSIYAVMACAYGNQEKQGDALFYAKQSLRIALELFGDDHNHTETAYNNLGSSYLLIPNYTRACECYEKAIEIAKRIRSGCHRHSGNDYYNYAQALRMQENYEKTIEVIQYAIQQYQNMHPSSFESISARILLLECEWKTKRLLQCEIELEKINALCKDTYDYSEISGQMPKLRRYFNIVAQNIYEDWEMKEEVEKCRREIILNTVLEKPEEIVQEFMREILQWAPRDWFSFEALYKPIDIEGQARFLRKVYFSKPVVKK